MLLFGVSIVVGYPVSLPPSQLQQIQTPKSAIQSLSQSTFITYIQTYMCTSR